MLNLLLPATFILVAGLTTISSISSRLFFLQSAWVAVGICIVLFFIRFDWRAIFNYRWIAWTLYGSSVLLLIIAYIEGTVIRNTTSWVVLGSFTFQPVELAKIALIVVFARYFSRQHLSVARWRTIIFSFVIFVVPAGLTLLQPDLGSASILFGIWFGFLLVSGLPRRRIALAFVTFAVVGILAWNFALRDYQRNRIAGVFYPESQALTVNYSVIQAKIAIGSAGLLGKGYNQGSQTQLGFLTEPSNDFILAAFIEEWGILAGLLLIGAFLALEWRILKIGLIANSNFEKFIALGTALVFGLHFLVNAGSTVGLFPVVGVPFPFLSYGGSNLLTSFFLLAMVNAIGRRA
jgi:rod shape determining protein RodA